MCSYEQKVSFGDCDPAGIVFYPNMFRWIDAAFHHYLRQFGGHAQICKDLGAIGIGTTNVSASFRSPLRDGDVLDIEVLIKGTQPKSLELVYRGCVGDRLAFEGFETRAVFVTSEKGISAANIGALTKIISRSASP